MFCNDNMALATQAAGVPTDILMQPACQVQLRGIGITSLSPNLLPLSTVRLTMEVISYSLVCMVEKCMLPTPAG